MSMFANVGWYPLPGRIQKELLVNTQSLLIKTSMYFLIVLFHSALTRPVAAIDDPGDANNLSVRPSQHELHLGFDGILGNAVKLNSREGLGSTKPMFIPGVVQKSLRIGPDGQPVSATIELGDDLRLNRTNDFSVVFWIRTTTDVANRFVVLSKKQIPNNSLKSHKQKGWAFCVSDGTWAWNIGSGDRRLTYERDNGQRMRINDGRWHQLAMTYEHSKSLIRLYFDGVNWTTYNIADKDGFDFSNDSPLTIGWSGEVGTTDSILPIIKQGADNLQKLVDRFNELGLGDLQPDELMNLVIGSERLIRARMQNNSDRAQELPGEQLESIKNHVEQLSKNPYTVHQVADFMQVAPLLKLYRLVDSRIEIDRAKAEEFAARERLCHPEFDIDELAILQQCLDSDQIRAMYSAHFQFAAIPMKKKLGKLTAAVFNIHHGGKHETVEEDGWDSRELIADIIKREDIDVVMMQETYSSGDFIAAELGYYFATTVDWDYLNQGANISVLSRYPISEIVVPPKSSFMNVAARVAISETQEVFVMSNWYGMGNFQDVFEFHESRFSKSENVPVLFGGDFNAVPHTDGGQSPASKLLLESGFRDAYRDSFPDVNKHAGASHQSGRRIDQLYYKGGGLKHFSTRVLSTWPTKFPSDHFLIKSIFELDFETIQSDQ